jgi:Tol biopolymer transport system component
MPCVSPDGREILYLSDADGDDNLWACAIDGSVPRRLTWETDAILTDPVWGPERPMGGTASPRALSDAQRRAPR